MAIPKFFTPSQLAYLIKKLQKEGKTKDQIARLLACDQDFLEGYQKGRYLMGKDFQLRCLQVFNTNFKRD